MLQRVRHNSLSQGKQDPTCLRATRESPSTEKTTRESPSTEKTTTKKDSIDIGTDMIHLVNKWCKLMVPINTVQYCKCMFFYDFLNNIFFPLAYFESVR